ncbi:hypothetical protein D3C87_1028030 [compost metagenome]
MGLEVDQQAAAVERGVIAVDTDVGRQALHRRILQNDFRQFLLTLAHRGEGDRLRRFGDALNHPGVLHREEAFRHDHVKEYGQPQRSDGHQQGQRLVFEHPAQHPPVLGNHPVNHRATGPIETALLVFFRFAFEQTRAHHRRQGQRDHQRNQDRHGQGDGKLAEQPPDHVGHEQQRDQYRDQRQGQGNQGETDLLGAFERGLHRAVAFFDKARDVLKHDDGVVDHEAGGNGQRHQGQVVDREAGQIHHAESTDQRQRHRHRRNDRGTGAPQEQKRHHHHQGDGDQQFVLHVSDRGADGLRAIRQHRHFEAGRQVVGNARQQCLDTVDHLDDVGTRLTLDVQQYRLILVGPRSETFVLGAIDNFRHVLEPQRRAVLVGEDQVGVILGRGQLVVGVEHRHPRRAVKVTLRLVDVGSTDQGAHVRQVQAVGRQRFRVDLDAHGLTLTAGNADHADAADLGDFLRHARIDQVIEFGQQHGFRGDRQGQHRGVRRVDLVVHRRRRQIGGQQIGRGVDCGLHLLLGDVHVDVEAETQRQHRRTTGTGRGHLREARHLPELALERCGDSTGHHVRAGAGIQGHDADGRVIDLWQRRNWQQAISDQAGQDNGQHAQGGGYRSEDEQPRNVHAPFLALSVTAASVGVAADLPCRCSVGVVGT